MKRLFTLIINILCTNIIIVSKPPRRYSECSRDISSTTSYLHYHKINNYSGRATKSSDKFTRYNIFELRVIEVYNQR